MLIKLNNKTEIKTNPDSLLIKKTFKSGESFYTKSLKIKVIKIENKNANICIAVSKKISKLSVERNYIKRRIRGFFCDIAKRKNINGFLFYVIAIEKDINENFVEDFLLKFDKINF